MRKLYGEEFPEMNQEDYKLLISQLMDDDEIVTKQDAVRFIEDSVVELDERKTIPMRWLKAWCLYANEGEKIIVQRVMREWIQACNHDEAIKEIE